jgi:hypothetical protein
LVAVNLALAVVLAVVPAGALLGCDLAHSALNRPPLAAAQRQDQNL